MPSYSVEDTYLENEVLQAEGCRLVHLLYRSAIDAIDRARTHLRANEIQPRSREITKTLEILNELAQSLDHSAGGSISQNLTELYDYIQRLLLDGNFRQVDAPLAEAQSLLEVLLDGWEKCASMGAPGHVVPADVVPAHECATEFGSSDFGFDETTPEPLVPAWEPAGSAWDPASMWEETSTAWEPAQSAWEPASRWQPAASAWETSNQEYAPLDCLG